MQEEKDSSTSWADRVCVPLENNAEVMTHLAQKLGLAQDLAFHDVFSIDDPDLLAFVPRPAHALLLVFPISETYEKSRHQEDANLPEYQGHGPGEPAMWFKQTIRNSCGLIALLHAVANGEPRRHVTPGSDLAALLERADPLPPAERARSLQYSKGLESVYMDAAQMGDTEAPEAEDNVDLHFVAFVRGSDGTLWEMDGRRKGPLARGVLAPDEDVLSANALEMGVRRFLKAEIEGGNQDMRFSLICLGPGLD